MASAEENGFLRSLWSHWLVLMSGIISVLVSVGPYPITLGTFWPNLRWVRGFPNSTAWLVIGCGCLFGACYLAWKDERKKVHRLRTEVEELHGQPEVTLQCFAAAYRGPDFHGAFEFRLSNANDHVALNITISHIAITIWDNREELKTQNRKLSVGSPEKRTRDVRVVFGEAAGVAKDQTDLMPYRIEGAEPPQRIDLVYFLDRDNSRSGASKVYPVKLGFSNIRGSRWEADYELEYDYRAGQIHAWYKALRQVQKATVLASSF